MAKEDGPRVAVVTGASSGIGKETAKALAAQGWRVIALGRDVKRSAEAEAEIRSASSGAPVDMIIADLSLMADAARAAREVADLTDRIDVLVNNAGGVAALRRVTPDGNEGTFAGNHLGPFLLTNRLLPLLRAAASQGHARIVVTSSSGHEYTPGFDWDNLQMLDGYVSGRAYCNAKLANVLFTRALARRLAGDGIVVHAMHPGVVDTNFASTANEEMQNHLNTLDQQTPEQGADTLIWLATADEPGKTTGGYFYNREAVPMSAVAQDDAQAERLWAESETLIARSGA